MKIVIEIDELVYEGCLILNRANEATVIQKAVVNGTPLPKGHGRIIDEDKIGEFRIGSMCKFMTNAPTIIEGSDSE